MHQAEEALAHLAGETLQVVHPASRICALNGAAQSPELKGGGGQQLRDLIMQFPCNTRALIFLRMDNVLEKIPAHGIAFFQGIQPGAMRLH